MATMAPTICQRPGERLATAQYKNGTMAVESEMIKPEMPGVVPWMPMTWREIAAT